MFDEEATQVIHTDDGGYAILGTASVDDGQVQGTHNFRQDFWIVKTNVSGIVQWTKCIGGNDFEYPSKIIQTHDHGFVVVGSTDSHDGDVTVAYGNDDVLVAKLDSTGNLLWTKTLGGQGYDYGETVLENADHSLLVGASVNTLQTPFYPCSLGGSDVVLYKLDSIGNLISTRCYGGSGDDGIGNLIALDNGRYCFAGGTNSLDGDVSHPPANHDESVWLVVLDSSGNILWDNCYTTQYACGAFDVRQTSDHGFILAGEAQVSCYFYEDAILLKVDSLGNEQSRLCLGGYDYDRFYSITPLSDSTFVAIGFTESVDGDITLNYGLSDIFTVEFTFPYLSNSVQDMQPNSLSISKTPSGIKLFFRESTLNKVSGDIYDVSGRKLSHFNISDSPDEVSYSIPFTASPGVYVVSLKTQNGEMHKGFVW
ncbi:MAG: hypothetical protein U0X76_06530 [Bacteroidia bacterium]